MSFEPFSSLQFFTMTSLALCALFLLSPGLIRAIPIDNGVEGDPEIECSADSISVNFNVRNDFQGHVYVKGRFAEGAECRNDGGGSGRRVAGIKLAFTACGTKRERSLSPKGIFVSNTVVITFHPQFLTKVDRAYTVQCFYMEADKTVSQELEVSEITTAIQTQAAPMPLCRYDILEGGPDGQPVKFAIIGQQVYHKWTCETETVDMFCALIHSCTVDDGAGNSVQLLNDQGCALDKHLLGNLEYQTDLMAGHEAHVFKYADKPALFFNCQISILGKEPGQQCQRPQCAEPAGLGGAGAGSQSVVQPVSRNATRRVSPPRGSTPQTPGGPYTPAPPPPPRASSPPYASPRPSPPPSIGSPRPSSPLGAPTAGRTLPPAPVVSDPARRRDAAVRGRKFRFRYARAVDAEKENETLVPESSIVADTFGTWDVAAQAITALEIGLDDTSLPSYLKRHHQLEGRSSNGSTLFTQAIDHRSNNRLCIQPLSFAITMALAVITAVVGIAITALSCIRRTSLKLY